MTYSVCCRGTLVSNPVVGGLWSVILYYCILNPRIPINRVSSRRFQAVCGGGRTFGRGDPRKPQAGQDTQASLQEASSCAVVSTTPAASSSFFGCADPNANDASAIRSRVAASDAAVCVFATSFLITIYTAGDNTLD